MQTVAEMPEFIARSEKLLSTSERQALITHLAHFPSSGVLIRGTGDIRKPRWARQGSGQSGGVRVVYFFHNPKIPLFLLTLFAKGEKASVRPAAWCCCNISVGNSRGSACTVSKRGRKESVAVGLLLSSSSSSSSPFVVIMAVRVDRAVLGKSKQSKHSWAISV